MAHGLGSVAGRVAVVTGAANGIGRAVALALAKKGATLVVCDLDERGLTTVAAEVTALGARIFAERADVTNVEEIRRFARESEARFGPAELVVNVAGMVVLAPFLATTHEDWTHVIDVNVKGPVNVCSAFLPAMVARGRGGYVVNVASAAAFATQSELAAYGTTKHALVGLSQALADELFANGIGVSLVCPGFVATGILERARVRGPDPETARKKAEDLLRWRRLSPERVAVQILRAAERGDAVVPVGFEARALWVLSRLTPTLTTTLFARVRSLAGRT